MRSAKSDLAEGDSPLMQRQHNLSTLRGFMTELEQLIHIEYEALMQQWNEFETKRDEVNRIHASLNSVGKDDDRLKLNVGGEKFEIRESCTRSNTYFRALFSKTFTKPDADGYFYIDRDPEMVPFLLNYLRRTQSVVDTQTRLGALNDTQLELLHDDCEFYMATDLMALVSHHMELRGASHRILQVPFNVEAAKERCNGLVFEINVETEAKLLGLRIPTAEPTTNVTAELYYKAGGINGGNSLRKVSTANLLISTGELGSFQFTAIMLHKGLHTLAIYSPTGMQPLLAAPRAEAKRKLRWCTMEHTYHVIGVRGLQSPSGEDVLDFAGEMSVSFGNDK